MRFVLLSLVVLMSLIHQYNCLPRKPIPKKDSNVAINDEVRRLMDLLEKKTNTDKQAPAKERTGSKPIPTIAKYRSAHGKQDGDACPAEPQRLTASSGTIQSPGYSESDYPDNAKCKWLIEAPAGKVISVTVDEVSLEYCPNCAYDSVSLYDGSTESSTVLKKLCSTTSDSTTSSGSTVLVVFKSDSSESTGRFKLNWEFVGGDACGGEPERLSESSGTIQSPGYDSSTYPNDANCQWIIEAPAGKVIKLTAGGMSLEHHADCDYDSLTLYDGSTESSTVLKKLCSTTAIVTSSGSTVLVVFKSDHSVNSGRFSLSWIFEEQSDGGPGPQAQCGRTAIQPDVTFSRIHGGSEARPNSWPWQCLLLAGGFMCGASVISNNYVLTAAHCVYQLTPVKVYCGVHDISYAMYSDPKVQRFEDVTVTIHENYGAANSPKYVGHWDIAVVRLNTPLTFNDYVQPACLPSTPVPVGTECVLTGFGRTESGSTSDLLLQVVVPILSNDECATRYRDFPSRLLCLGPIAGGRSSCKGDSGGPLVIKQGEQWFQYGITNFGMSASCDALPNQPYAYADVVAYLPWIQEKTGVRASARMDNKKDNKKIPIEEPPMVPYIPVKKNDRKDKVEKELLRLLQRTLSD